MNTLLSFRIPREFRREIKEAAAKKGISLSSEILYRLNKYSELLEESIFYKQIRQQFAGMTSQDGKNSQLLQLLIENNMLLRKIGRFTNSQLVIETDEQMKLKFGKDWLKNIE